ncbi:ABC transporter permease [Streptococcus suis]|uniref:ABC transporter permease n=1 Tax=Streptococcus suis TaxID=1307 RepID=UPI002E284584|nr:ABC transporter permease [Streptococcus suis]
MRLFKILLKSTYMVSNTKDYVILNFIIPLVQAYFFVSLLSSRTISNLENGNIFFNNIIFSQFSQLITHTSHSIAREREIHTLRDLFLSKRGIFSVFSLKMLLHVIVTTGTTVLFLLISCLLDRSTSLLSVLFIIATILFSNVFISLFSLFWGIIGLHFKNILLILNTYLVIQLLLSGINVPFDKLPGILVIISNFLPLTYLIEAINVGEFSYNWFVALGKLATCCILYFIVGIFLLKKISNRILYLE